MGIVYFLLRAMPLNLRYQGMKYLMSSWRGIYRPLIRNSFRFLIKEQFFVGLCSYVFVLSYWYGLTLSNMLRTDAICVLR